MSRTVTTAVPPAQAVAPVAAVPPAASVPPTVDARIAALEAQALMLWSGVALAVGVALLSGRRGARQLAVGTLRAERVQIVGPRGGAPRGPWWRPARPGPIVGHVGVSPIDGVPECARAGGAAHSSGVFRLTACVCVCACAGCGSRTAASC